MPCEIRNLDFKINALAQMIGNQARDLEVRGSNFTLEIRDFAIIFQLCNLIDRIVGVSVLRVTYSLRDKRSLD